MDPKVIVERSGFAVSPQGPDEGRADYLRHMRQLNFEPQSSAPVSSSPNENNAPSGKERRRSPRFRCSGSAEFRVEGSDVRMWGTLSDVSLHGCYVEMNNTFPVDTRVHLVLDTMGIRAQMTAVVRVS